MKQKNRYLLNIAPEKMESLIDDYKRCGFDTTRQGSTLIVHTARKATSKKSREKRGEVSKAERKFGHVKKEAVDESE